MKEYLTIYSKTKKETLNNYQSTLKKQLQEHLSNNRTFQYTFDKIVAFLGEEISQVNSSIFKQFPQSWDLFRDRTDFYTKHAELHILSNEVQDAFKQELGVTSLKSYSYEKFIEDITTLDTLIFATDVFKQNSQIVRMMFELNQFKWFKFIPNTDDHSYLALKAEYATKMDSQALDTSDNTFNNVRNLKNNLKSKKPTISDNIDIQTIDFDALAPLIEELVLSKIEENTVSRDEKLFMDTNQVAKLLHLEKQTIYGLVHEDKIPYEKVGQKLYFIKQEIMDWVLSGRKKEPKNDEEIENFFKTKHKYNK